MKPKFSDLVLSDFTIINSTFNFSSPETGVKTRELVSKYEIDLDFAINVVGEKQKVFVKVSINQTANKLKGYSIFAEGVAFFSLNNIENLNKEQKDSLTRYSAVSIAINLSLIHISEPTRPY